MKNAKRILSLVLALVLCLGLATVAMAANSTITVKNAQAGTTYSVYKVFSATTNGSYDPNNAASQGIAYTLDDTSAFYEDLTAGAIDGATVTVSDTAGKYNVTVSDAAAFAAWLKTKAAGKNALDSETCDADATSVTLTVSDKGYYFVNTSVGTLADLNTVTGNIDIYDKNEKDPHVPEDGKFKKVVDAEGNEIELSTAKIGETVNFELSFIATNYKSVEEQTTPQQITEYTIVDAPKGMKINIDSVEVTVNGNEPTTDVAKTENGDGMTVVVDWADASGASVYPSPSTVVVKYTATITAAVLDEENATATNTARVNDTTISGETETKTYSFDLRKVDAETETTLNGAEFKLLDANKTEIPVVAVDGGYRVAEEGETGVAIVAGEVNIAGLKGNSTYYLEETKAPDGYNLLAEPYEVTIAKADNTFANNGGVVVKNATGTNLPSTGGIGTTIFYVIGGILVVGAGVLLVTKKRMAHHD